MSRLMEDRLAAALRARADQVQPEDLRPLDVPVTSLRRHPRAPWVLGLAAAASVAVVAMTAPLVVGGADRAATPPPATDPVGRTLHTAEADVDGDSVLDAVRIVRTDGELELVVDLGSGRRAAAPVPHGSPGPVLDAGNLGGGPGVELVVPVSDRPADLPHVFTLLGEDDLARATFPSSGVEGWRLDAPQNRWTVTPDGLRTWEAERIEGDKRFPYWDWTVDEQARLRPGPIQLGCAAPEDAPAPCDGKAEPSKGGPDLGPRGDLPVLLPAVEERYGTGPYAYGVGFSGAGSEDYAQLLGDLGLDAGAVEKGDVELLVTRDGVEHRAPVPPGQSPWLVPQFLGGVHGDAPVLLVEQSGGDSSQLTVFAFGDDGELRQVEPVGDVFLGSGFVDRGGEMTEQRTWITPAGQLFTAVLLDHETRRHQLFRWNDNLGETIAPTDLGEACIDWETGDYGRCP